MEQFYSIFSTICFFLMGLWWNVTQARQAEWMQYKAAKRMSYTIYMTFLLPGMMSLGAQLSDDLKVLWRIIFVLIGVMGIWVTLVQIPQVSRIYPNAWFMQRARWLIVGFYAVLVLFALLPNLQSLYAPLKPLQIEALLLGGILFLGVNMAWEFMAQPKLSELQIQNIQNKNRPNDDPNSDLVMPPG